MTTPLLHVDATSLQCRVLQFRSALEERNFVNKRNEVAQLVEEATHMVVRLDGCHSHIRELQIGFRQIQAQCVSCGCTPCAG